MACLRAEMIVTAKPKQPETVLAETVVGATARALLGATVPGLMPYTGA